MQSPRKSILTSEWLLPGCATIIFTAFILAILFPVPTKPKAKAEEVSCMSNQKQLGLALLQYEQDYDSHFPPAASWMDRTADYTHNKNIYRCPSVSHKSHRKYGYAFNINLDRRSTADISHLSTMPTTYDSPNLARNATDAVASLPHPGRHNGYNIIAYADGHVAASRLTPSAR